VAVDDEDHDDVEEEDDDDDDVANDEFDESGEDLTEGGVRVLPTHPPDVL